MENKTLEDKDFFREYFIQTRKELSAARGELNRMLNIAILILGAFVFALLQNDAAAKAIQKPVSFIPLTSALALITLLFWFRRALLQDMTNRWFVLVRMAQRHFPESTVDELLEAVVISSIKKKRYVMINFMLTLIMSSPVYALLMVCSSNLELSSMPDLLPGILIVLIHIGMSYFLLRKPLISPFP